MPKRDNIKQILENNGFTKVEVQYNEYNGEYSFTSKQLDGKMYLGYSYGAALFNANKLGDKRVK